ncbi:MAG: hypothetical protein F7C35_02240 [Desulfurococcales archaeon]|nr:hypothetical protein [Desulfurococcales archaeon]
MTAKGERKSKLLNPRIIELEGMAMAGLVRKARIVECGDNFPLKDWMRIVAELEDGSTYETGCMEPEDAKRNFMVITLYARKWGKMINTGEQE